jgi:hypothetical protein
VDVRRRAGLALLGGLLLAALPSQALAHTWVVSPSCSFNGNPYWFGGGPASDWLHSSDPPNPGCHWYTHTSGGAAPENTAAFYLPISANFDHFYRVYEWISSLHTTTPSMKWRRYPHGTGGGFSSCTRGISGYSNSYVNVTNFNFYGSDGGYIQMVDNYPSAGYWVTGDYLYYTT